MPSTARTLLVWRRVFRRFPIAMEREVRWSQGLEVLPVQIMYLSPCTEQHPMRKLRQIVLSHSGWTFFSQVRVQLGIITRLKLASGSNFLAEVNDSGTWQGNWINFVILSTDILCVLSFCFMQCVFVGVIFFDWHSSETSPSVPILASWKGSCLMLFPRSHASFSDIYPQ